MVRTLNQFATEHCLSPSPCRQRTTVTVFKLILLSIVSHVQTMIHVIAVCLPQVDVSSPNAESESTLCTNTVLSQPPVISSTQGAAENKMEPEVPRASTATSEIDKSTNDSGNQPVSHVYRALGPRASTTYPSALLLSRLSNHRPNLFLFSA